MSKARFKLFKIRGGIHPRMNKQTTASRAIVDLPLAPVLRIPLLQHSGNPAQAIVKAGDYVFKGQLLAHTQGKISAAIHSPSSGYIVAIEPFPAPHPSGLPITTITLKTDGLEQWQKSQTIKNPFELTAVEIADKVAQAGIVGMGGAAFPAAVKLELGEQYNINTLIINGAECEPYLTCDDRLMQEHADDIIHGIRIMAYALNADISFLAIEKNKPKAIAAMKKAAMQFEQIKVITVPAQYPMGSEKHLSQAITGKETPANALTAEIGIVVHNIATAYAICRTFKSNEPLISRVVTVTGAGIKKPTNFRAAIGTPVSYLIKHAGGLTAQAVKIILGGPMMGQTITTTQVPITKASGGIVVLTEKELAHHKPSPCIRCASCVKACPVGLMPVEIVARSKAGDLQGAVDYGLMDCIACGACAYVCPSHLPLVQYFNYAKGELKQKQLEQHKQEEIKQFITARSERLKKQKQKKMAALAKRKAEIAAGQNQPDIGSKS